MLISPWKIYEVFKYKHFLITEGKHKAWNPTNYKKKPHKLQEESIGETFSDINRINVSLGQSHLKIDNKSKNKQMGPNKRYKLLHSKGNHPQNEKRT